MNKQIQEGKTKTATYNTTGAKMIIKVNAQSSEEIATSGYAQPKEQELETLLQDNERFEKDYTVFTFKFNGVPIKFVALADAEQAIKIERNRIVEIVKKLNVQPRTELGFMGGYNQAIKDLLKALENKER